MIKIKKYVVNKNELVR